jgi:hypothetical protein
MWCDQLISQNSISLEILSRSQGKAYYHSAVISTNTNHNIHTCMSHRWIALSYFASPRWRMTCSWGKLSKVHCPNLPGMIMGSHGTGNSTVHQCFPQVPQLLSGALPWPRALGCHHKDWFQVIQPRPSKMEAFYLSSTQMKECGQCTLDFSVLAFERRASHLPGRCSTTWATSSTWWNSGPHAC